MTVWKSIWDERRLWHAADLGDRNTGFVHQRFGGAARANERRAENSADLDSHLFGHIPAHPTCLWFNIICIIALDDHQSKFIA